MWYDRDELRLLSRGGRVPPAVRAGPPGGRGRDQLPGAEPWVLQVAVAAVAGMLRPGRSARQPPRESAPAVGYADPEGYLELEFAVGFAAEDEPWLQSTQG